MPIFLSATIICRFMTCIWRKLSIFSLKSFLSHYHLKTSPLSSSSPHLTLLWLPSIITIIMVISFNVVTLHCTAYSFKISMNVTMEAIRVMWMQTVKTRMALTTASVRKDTLGMDNRAKVYRNRNSQLWSLYLNPHIAHSILNCVATLLCNNCYEKHIQQLFILTNSHNCTGKEG